MLNEVKYSIQALSRGHSPNIVKSKFQKNKFHPEYSGQNPNFRTIPFVIPSTSKIQIPNIKIQGIKIEKFGFARIYFFLKTKYCLMHFKSPP
jgi:hypothetical protein